MRSATECKCGLEWSLRVGPWAEGKAGCGRDTEPPNDVTLTEHERMPKADPDQVRTQTRLADAKGRNKGAGAQLAATHGFELA